MRGSPILNLNLQCVVVAGVPLLVALVAGGYIRRFKFPGVDMEASVIKQNVESAIENSELRRQAVKEIPGDFEKIKLYIDWQKFHEAVVAWAIENKAQNAWNLGPKNFLRCLYDLGIPGGKRFELEREQDGAGFTIQARHRDWRRMPRSGFGNRGTFAALNSGSR
jgi:hypothetical protein